MTTTSETSADSADPQTLQKGKIACSQKENRLKLKFLPTFQKTELSNSMNSIGTL